MTTARDDLLALAGTLRKATGAGHPSPDREWRGSWPRLAGLGVIAFCAAREHDGFGAEVPAALVTARELGAALHGAPYPAIVAASYALTRWLPGGQRPAVADAIIAGEHVPTLAFLDPAATVAAHADGTVTVTGTARLAAGAAGADSLLVLPAGTGMLLFIRREAGITVTAAGELDITREAGDVTFDATPALSLAAPPGGRALAERLHGLLLAGDTLGGLTAMLDKTVAYAAGRTAFGTVIGAYQAVQHRLVDHAVALRGMSLLADRAASLLAGAERAGDEAQPGPARAVLLAEARVAATALPVLHDLVQLTGAIGFTWEYGLHLHERRAHLNARLARNPRQARRLLAAQSGWTAPDAN